MGVYVTRNIYILISKTFYVVSNIQTNFLINRQNNTGEFEHVKLALHWDAHFKITLYTTTAHMHP